MLLVEATQTKKRQFEARGSSGKRTKNIVSTLAEVLPETKNIISTLAEVPPRTRT